MKKLFLHIFLLTFLINCPQELKAVDDDSEINTRVAIKYINSGNYDEGMDFLEKALKVNKNNAKAQHAVGFIFEFQKKDFKKAAKWYTAAQINGYKVADVAIDRVISKSKPIKGAAVSSEKKHQ